MPEWMAVFGPGKPQASIHGGTLTVARVAESKFTKKNARQLRLEAVRGLAYIALELLIDDDSKVVDYRPRKLSPGIVQMLMARRPPAVAGQPGGGVTKKPRMPRVANRGAPYSFFTELPIEARTEFPQLKWAFAPWSEAIGLFRYYPVELLQALHISQINLLLQTKDNTIHLFAAVKGLPYIMRAWSAPPHDDPDVYVALGVWEGMIEAYLNNGTRGGSDSVYRTLLGSPWGVVTEKGDFARWAADEEAFRTELPTKAAKIYKSQNAFSLEWVAFINSLCSERPTAVVCPGRHFCNSIRRSRGLTDASRLCTWSDDIPAGCEHVVVVLAEYVSVAEWRRLFKSMDNTMQLTMIGDPAHEIRNIQRGSPFDGFKIACDLLGAEEPQELTWPLQHADGKPEWRSLASLFLAQDEKVKPPQLVWRSDVESILALLASGKMPVNHGVLSFVPSITSQMDTSVRGGAPATLITPTESAMGQWNHALPPTVGDTVALGDMQHTLAWHDSICATNVGSAHNFWGLPVDYLYVIVKRQAPTPLLTSMLPYATKGMVVVMLPEE